MRKTIGRHGTLRRDFHVGESVAKKKKTTSLFTAGTPRDGTPHGDAERQAIASLKGYAYQVAAAALAWIDGPEPVCQQVAPHPPGAIGPVTRKEAGANLRPKRFVVPTMLT